MTSKKSLRLVLIYTGSRGFPLGDAYTNRVLSIAKGLVNSGCSVKIFIIYPGRESGVSSKSGVFDSVEYEYLTERITTSNPLANKLIGIWGILHAFFRIVFLKNTDAIITFSESIIQNAPLSFASKLRNIKFIREVNEFPKKVLKRGSVRLSNVEKLLIILSLKCYDALICISNGLYEYYRTKCSFKKPILIVPIMVDLQRFPSYHNKTPEKYITYCGNLFGDKDGVDILLKAFNKILYKHPEYKLRLIGDTSKEMEFRKLKLLIKDLHLSDHVVFTGYVKRNKIPSLLCKSSVLALARPNNIQAKGGFPTKLGEYLATGRPVIVTSVGDIPKYIQDNVNGFLVVPGNVNSFASKLDYVLSNYNNAKIVGFNGRKLAEKVFNAKVQTISIVSFIINLKERSC